jgi:hypothetical protein
MLFGLLCGLLFDVQHRVFAALAVQTAFFLLVVVRNPYRQCSMKARSILNESTALLILIATVVQDYTKVKEVAWGEAVLLLVCTIYSLVCFVLEAYWRFKGTPDCARQTKRHRARSASCRLADNG